MVSKWQTLFILVMTLPIMGHVVILPIMLDVAGRDIIISILLSLPVALLFAYAIFRIRLKYPGEKAEVIFEDLLGKWGGRFLRLIFIVYFLFLTIISFDSIIFFVFISFFHIKSIILFFFLYFIFFLFTTYLSL